MFTPQVKKAVTDTNIKEEDYDVSTQEGLNEANKYKITHSGVAILTNDDGKILFTWEHPVPSDQLIKVIRQFL
jgi:cytochrome oxidase Cu insertion factor (SCO1/SenC/PrrC family)